VRYMTTVLDKNSPIQQRSEPSEDLRTIISRAFLMAQNAANQGGSVSVDVWEESGDASKNPWAKIGQISVNFARVPSLLLRAPIESTTTALAIGDGKPAAGAPAHVACPYCDGVMQLREDLNGIRYDYSCTSCNWESSYSPSQAAEWLRKFPIRSDGGRLAAPVFEYDKPKSVTALASFRSGKNLALLVYVVKNYGEHIKVYSGRDGKEMGDGIKCRTPQDRAMALGLAKRFLEDKLDVEIHDQDLHKVQPIDLWATPPATRTSVADLKEIIENEVRGYAYLVTTSGKTIECHRPRLTALEDGIEGYSIKTPIPLSELAQLRVNGEPSTYGENVKIILWQNPDWDPNAKPSKNGKGKKGMFPPAQKNQDLAAIGRRIEALDAWADIYAEDENDVGGETAVELADKTYERIEALRTLSEGGEVPEGVPADDEDLLGAWRALYPEMALGETVRSMQPEAVAA